ncbi:MAG: serine acetyltransferase [Peptococcaceae bacterium]|jgi:serine O-acetyltransferase|nr:serine acetyltransferase [Peptococcaceae bacterium]
MMPEERIHQLMTNLLDSYRTEESMIKIEASGQLSREAIIRIIGDLRRIIFAGYFSEKPLRWDSLEYYIGNLLEQVLYTLAKQIEHALPYHNNDGEPLPSATELSDIFAGRLSAIRSLLATDIEAAYDGDPSAFNRDEIILSYPGIFAIMVHRLAHELYLLGVPLVPRMMSEYAHSLTGIDIHPGATIGHHLFIDHGTGIVIGETAIIGNFVKIYQGVTIGALSTRGGQLLHSVKRHPTIEDHVTIYSGASILGGGTVIGEGVVIGSNAFITRSVPEKTRVSVKNPELQFKLDDKMHNVEFVQDNAWFYTI